MPEFYSFAENWTYIQISPTKIPEEPFRLNLMISEICQIRGSFGLISADFKSAATNFEQWQNGFLDKYGMSLKSSFKNYSDIDTSIKSGLLPLTTPVHTRYLFLETFSKWTVFFDNGLQGTDSVSIMRVLADVVNTESIGVVLSSKKGFEARIMSVFVSKEISREIYVSNDCGNWCFGQNGDPLSFENIHSYEIRDIQSRFTERMLVDYLTEMEALPFNDDWFTGNAVVLDKKGSLPKTLKTYKIF